MTGRESLEKLLDTLKHWQGRNTIFDKIHSKHILDELELLEKYKRAFENLKYSIENAIEELKKEKTSMRGLGYKNGREAAYKGVLNLLEELMKGETSV